MKMEILAFIDAWYACSFQVIMWTGNKRTPSLPLSVRSKGLPFGTSAEIPASDCFVDQFVAQTFEPALAPRIPYQLASSLIIGLCDRGDTVFDFTGGCATISAAAADAGNHVVTAVASPGSIPVFSTFFEHRLEQQVEAVVPVYELPRAAVRSVKVVEPTPVVPDGSVLALRVGLPLSPSEVSAQLVPVIENISGGKLGGLIEYLVRTY